MTKVGQVARVGLGVAAVLSPFATHFLVATGAGLPLAIGLASAQWVLALAALGRAWMGRAWIGGAWMGRWALVSAIAAAALVGFGAYRAAGSIPAEAGLLAVSGVTHVAINGMLLAVFAATLAPGRTPLVVAMGRRLDPYFTPAIARYARGVTWAWVAFFAAQIALSGVLLAMAPRTVWSFFVNILDLPLVVAVFVIEDRVRRWRFPGHPHVSLRSLAAAMRAGGGWRGLASGLR